MSYISAIEQIQIDEAKAMQIFNSIGFKGSFLDIANQVRKQHNQRLIDDLPYPPKEPHCMEEDTNA